MNVKSSIFAGLAVSIILAGCASTQPMPKNIDLTKIPVENGSVAPSPGSLWAGETSRNALFNDLRARNVGDVVTIAISEKTSAIKTAATSTARNSAYDAELTKLLGLPLNMNKANMFGGGNTFSPGISGTYANKFDGSGTTKRSGELSATIASRVVAIMPNGNLVLQGTKDIVVNNETQYIVLSGIARPEDINDANTISSTLLSDAKIEYSGKGTLSDEQSQGWLGRILDNYWPF